MHSLRLCLLGWGSGWGTSHQAPEIDCLHRSPLCLRVLTSEHIDRVDILGLVVQTPPESSQVSQASFQIAHAQAKPTEEAYMSMQCDPCKAHI